MAFTLGRPYWSIRNADYRLDAGGNMNGDGSTLFLQEEHCTEPQPMKRVPVTKEIIADLLAAELRGERLPHPDKEYLVSILCDSVAKMVNMLANRYDLSCCDGQQDLVQLCMIRIWKKLHRYDSSKGAFTTWSWRLCSNVLKTRWIRSKKQKQYETVLTEEVIDSISGGEERNFQIGLLRSEIARAVRALIREFPTMKKVIIELLGNPYLRNYMPPANPDFTRCSEATGVSTTRISSFWHKEIQPFLQKRISR